MNTECINIIKSFEKGDFKPIYLFHGEENYYLDILVKNLMQHALSEIEREFNQFVYFGSDVQAQQLVDLCRQYPMMAERRLIIIKDADQLNFDESIEHYLSDPEETTVLALVMTKKIDKRKKFYQLAKKKAVEFESKKLYENQIPAWISNYSVSKGFQTNPDAVQLIAEHVGNDLSRLSKELDKLYSNKNEGDTITIDDVYRYVGISKEYNVFELNKYLGVRNGKKVFQIAQNLMDNIKNNDPIWLVAAIFGYFQKVMIYHAYHRKGHKRLMEAMGLHSNFFLKEYQEVARNYSPNQIRKGIQILAETDLKLKGLGQDQLPREEIFIQSLVKILSL